MRTKKIIVAILIMVCLIFIIYKKVDAKVYTTEDGNVYVKFEYDEEKCMATEMITDNPNEITDLKWGGDSLKYTAKQGYIKINENSSWNGTTGVLFLHWGYKKNGKLVNKPLNLKITDDNWPTIYYSRSGSTITIEANDKTSGIESFSVNGSAKSLTSGKYRITNISNTTYKIIAKDKAGHTQTRTIDNKMPVLTIKNKKQDGTEIKNEEFTNQDITVNVVADEGIKEVNGWTLSGNTLSKTYTENAQETITVSDTAPYANTTTYTIKITNIDKSAPQITGVTNGGKYTAKINPKATDTNLDKVTLKKDDVEQTSWQNGQEVTEQGTYEITATDKAGNRTVYKFSVSIPKEEIKIQPEEYKAYEIIKIIAYVQPEETVENFIKKLNVQPEEAKVVVLDSEGNEVSKEAKVKTGMKVKIEDEDTYVLSVLGDLNGDGEVNLIDITRVIVSVFFNEPKEDTVQGYEFAADYNKDGTTDMVDLTKMIKTALN